MGNKTRFHGISGKTGLGVKQAIGLIEKKLPKFYFNSGVMATQRQQTKINDLIDVMLGLASDLKEDIEVIEDLLMAAISEAKKNADNLGFTCEVFHSNLFEKIKGKFDLIVANLPYIEKESFSILQKEIILYEPHEALYGGISGVDIIKIFLSDVGRRLNRNGMFVIEFGEGQDILLRGELLKFRFGNFDFYTDLNCIKRVLCVKNNI